MAKFFVYPFGTSGDKTAIPNTGSSTGAVNYQYGWTPPYEAELGVDPGALPIPRDESNELYYQITLAIQQYQTLGVPDWITSSDNLGSPYPYAIFARVRYDAGSGFQVYENQVAANTATPGADNTWRIISGPDANIPTGTIIDFGGPLAPTGFLVCDGSAISRTTYAALLTAITNTQNGTTTNLSAVVTGLTDTSWMYEGMKIEGTGIPSGTSILTIDSGTQITMDANATASATVPIQFFPWSNGNGTTTFNVPDLRRRTTIGTGGSATTIIDNKVGTIGGEEAHAQTVNELATHNHAPATGGSSVFVVDQSSGPISLGGGGTNTVGELTTGDTGNGDAFNIMQPSAVVFKCIKF